MTQHPITPPPELVQQWDREWREQQNAPVIGWSANLLAYVAARAAQWAANQELEACCECLESHGWHTAAQDIRAARRPKWSSLKEEALEDLAWVDKNLKGANFFGRCEAVHTIRRALESIPDNE